MKKRSKFSLSHYVLKTCKMGYVLPVGLVEVLPGDSFRHATSVFMRLAPMLAPVMHPVTVRIHHWFIPTRLLWDDFEDFITGGPTNTDVSEFPTITAPSGGFAVGSLADHLGLPPKIDGIEVSALPFRAYNLVYNEWYRDQDLETEKALSLESGPDTTTATDLLRCDWERDYFTTARPWPQKGPDVSVPVTGSIEGQIPVVPKQADASPSFKMTGYNLGEDGVVFVRNSNSAGDKTLSVQATQIEDPNWQMHKLVWNDPGLVASGGSSVTTGVVNVNSLREAFALQRFAEHRAMYGSRYVEYLRYLGIKASDARLQRPEYLGGGKQTIQFSEVLQTAEGTDPVGTLRGHGIAAMRSNRYRRFFEEHGFVLSIMLVRPKAIYMQGIPRSWLRRVREDFFQTELQHIGQQEVYTKELYGAAPDGENGDLKVFGYQNRYDEYRGHESYVCGEFRDILDYWHLARSFANEPTLNADFISATPSERIFAAQQNDQLYCMINHSLQARRLMSKFGNPI